MRWARPTRLPTQLVQCLHDEAIRENLPAWTTYRLWETPSTGRLLLWNSRSTRHSIADLIQLNRARPYTRETKRDGTLLAFLSGSARPRWTALPSPSLSLLYPLAFSFLDLLSSLDTSAYACLSLCPPSVSRILFSYAYPYTVINDTRHQTPKEF